MALFTDGPASTIEDLTAQDSQLLNVSNSEGIDLTVKLELMQEAIGIELEELLRRSSSFGLGQVVVTPPLRLWHTYRTLEAVYRDAYNSQLNDRYAGKRDQFRELSKWAYDRVIQAGLGIALQPIPRPAPLQFGPGTGSMPDGDYYAAMAWVNALGEESECSEAALATASNGGFAAYTGTPPPGVTAWNVYAGEAPETMSRQNDAPIPAGTAWMPGELATSGAAPGRGQAPSYVHATPRLIQRG